MSTTSIMLASDTLCVHLSYDAGMPEITAIGAPTPGEAPLAQLGARPTPHGGLDAIPPLGLVVEEASGFAGRPGIVGARPDGSAWSPRFALQRAEQSDARSARFELRDEEAGLALTLALQLGDTLEIDTTLHNSGDTPYVLQRLAPSVPVPDHARETLSFGGRWCQEFQLRRGVLEGTQLVTNRRGRSAQQTLPALFAGSTGFDDAHGEVWAAQLAWSGNYELAMERCVDGRAHLQLGELLHSHEVVLAPGECYAAPRIHVAWSSSGTNDISAAFHRAVRGRQRSTRPRPVLLNTWEAVYFSHDLDVLQRLADAAADAGVERFVLDDGWFVGRRHPRAGLGDWRVCPDAWPQGLDPLISRVQARGMEFGLWVEPEMVNPDSELYRAHPEWTLTTPGYSAPLARHQLVLDLGRSEVRDYLYDALDALLTRYDIAYLKWDMNRDLVQGSHQPSGRAGAREHTLGLYALIDRLREAHPALEIESCSSGGGRADLGILSRCERIWTSDCNDALERQTIQRGFSLLFPPEVMGAHIGPERAQTTGRRQDLAFRAATALFGHLGVEWNLLDASDAEREQLRAAIALHKRLRPLLHAGRSLGCPHPDPAALVHGVVSEGAEHALFAYVQQSPSAHATPAAMRPLGLAPLRNYQLRLLDDLGPPQLSGRRAPEWLESALAGSLRASGAALMQHGIQLPNLQPESTLLFELEAV